MAGIKLINIDKRFGAKVLFHNFCALVSEGDFVLISGAPATGKTTLLNMMSGQLKPNSGDLYLDGQNLYRMNARGRRHFLERETGIITQNAYLEPRLTVRDNILLAAKYSTDPGAPSKDRLEELARILGIMELLSHRASEIAGNERVRVCLARALLLDPKFLFVDAPTDKLDGENAEKTLRILQLFQARLGKTVIVATSDARVRSYATKFIELRSVA